ncbi:Rieske (2Fe-2S) protein [Chryseosolibacter indicus]|uniref:Rieske 2Fe-2S domain-containing protein n=1 Tax=Chryseosolibacter indicus TaxID=2782351 RepID=A0ABS5VNP6_9BACT|nr:Rieske 2Fe-2S domain-containing protein [Chryseosolibacter indicus]MBT1703080.1 Rieske 2Fe-2S domain-containing protein [Chryseosolibacter indicus]
MEWIKIFGNKSEADHRIMNDKPQLIIIDGKRICLVRHKDEYAAVQDDCSHNGESLSKGIVNYLGEIICPWHNYCFELKGGKEIKGRSPDLKTFPVKADDTGFFIGI